MEYDAVVIGVSAGGMDALSGLLPHLEAKGLPPIFIVQHMAPDSDDFLATHLDQLCQVTVLEALMAMPIQRDHVYIAPANYHLVIGNRDTIELDMDNKVGFSRPSIDVLFCSASLVYGAKLLAIVLTGSNSDGAKGAKMVASRKGSVIVQSPDEAYSNIMPKAALLAVPNAQVLRIAAIANNINQIIGDLHA